MSLTVPDKTRVYLVPDISILTPEWLRSDVSKLVAPTPVHRPILYTHFPPRLMHFLIYLSLFLSLLPLLILLYIAHSIAFPSWHHPSPKLKTLTTRSLPSTWTILHPPSSLRYPHQCVSFPTHSSLTLHAWLLSASSTPTPIAVACVHGAGRDRRAFLSHAPFLLEQGFDLLLFDCTNHGISDACAPLPFGKWPGRAVTLGTSECEDVNSAVRYLSERGAQKVIVIGTSQGASAAILCAAEYKNIAALVLENPFISPRALVQGIVQEIVRRCRMPVLQYVERFVVWLALWRTGNLRATGAEDVIERVDIPVFFVHGSKDVMVGVWQSQLLFQRMVHGRKRIWVVEGAQHTQCFWRAPRQFEKKVVKFIDEFVR